MDSTAPHFYLVIIVAIVGACLGSFATVLIHRIPLKENWFFKKGDSSRSMNRSYCPACHHSLGIKDLFPILSWIMTRGKCRYCKGRISSSYPLTEITVAALSVGLFVWEQDPSKFIPAFLCLPFLVATIGINLKTGLNYGTASWGVFFLGCVFCIWNFQGAGNIIAALLLPSILAAISFLTFGRAATAALFRTEGIFLAGAGLFVGIQGMPVYLLLTAPLIALFVVYCVVRQRKNMVFLPSIYALALIFHFFLTGIGFDGRAVY